MLLLFIWVGVGVCCMVCVVWCVWIQGYHHVDSPTSPLFIDQTRARKSQKKPTQQQQNPKQQQPYGGDASDELNGVEVSPRALAVCETVAKIISKCRGAGTIMFEFWA